MEYKGRQDDFGFLLKSLRPRYLLADKREVIFRDETDQERVGIVLEGMVYLCVENEQCERQILQFFRPGDYFSAAMRIPVDRGLCYFVTKTASRIACFSRKEIFGLARYDGEWGARLSELCGRRLEHELMLRNFILQNRSIRSKLLAFFRREREIQNTNPIKMPIPFSDLADYLAVDRAAMMKELKRLKEEKVIQGKNRQITFFLEKP